MNNLVGEVANYKEIRFLEEFVNQFDCIIAGGCFKHLFNQEKVKDIDCFFRGEAFLEKAIEKMEDLCDLGEYYFYYENEKVKAYKHSKTGLTIELILKFFGNPEEIIGKFDFTVTKFCLYKDENGKNEVLYSKMFFEHLFQKRLVVDDELLYPHSTFDRCFRYARYGFSPCRETKERLILAIKETEETDVNKISLSLYDGMD